MKGSILVFMLKNRYVFFVLLCILVMAVFAYSYISAYNLEISYKLVEDEEAETTVEQVDAVNDQTEIVMEIYDINTQQIHETEFDKNVNLIGKNRSQVNEYIIDLNNTISEDERNQGLLSYQLVYFSNDYVTIRKNYDSSSYKSTYSLKEENGYVVVYEYPSGSIYHNTGIMTLSLDEEDRQALENGIEFSDINELFDFLESYSS